jgi:TRAP-type mannitol/chloroaromatic compound transport system permease small subunit
METTFSEFFSAYPTWIIVVVILLAIFDAVLRLIAMWQAAGRKQVAWYVCLGIFSTLGILPLVYLLTHRENKQ